MARRLRKVAPRRGQRPAAAQPAHLATDRGLRSAPELPLWKRQGALQSTLYEPVWRSSSRLLELPRRPGGAHAGTAVTAKAGPLGWSLIQFELILKASETPNFGAKCMGSITRVKHRLLLQFLASGFGLRWSADLSPELNGFVRVSLHD